jgi:hypothetical protein
MCTHVGDVCHHVPWLVGAALTLSDHECLLEIEYGGELPCTGLLIVGIEMILGAGEDIRHCCLEFRAGEPVGIYTYDFGGHWQAHHDAATLAKRTHVLQGCFPSWPFQGRRPGRVLSAFAIQNGARTASGVQVSERLMIAGEGVGDGSDRFHLEAC